MNEIENRALGPIAHAQALVGLGNRIIIDLFIDTAAILSLLDLRSILGCPGGTCSVFTRAFRAKKNFTVYLSGKRRSLLHPNRHNDLFFSLQSFSRKTQRKIGPKSTLTYTE